MDAKKVKSIRKKLGLTQDALARLLGVTPTTVSRWEQGVSAPDKWNEHQLRQLEKESAA